MRRKDFLRYAVAVVGGTAAAAVTGCGGGGDAGAGDLSSVTPEVPGGTGTVSIADPTLSSDEVAALRYMREEEKLAHDVYVALYASWGVQVFGNIAESETEHTEAILRLLQKYGVDDPAAGKAVGEFEDPSLQALHDQLVAQGRTSEIEGLKVGALIEETDIRDINSKIAITDNADIVAVYESLLCGSGNHLRAFNGQLLARGVTYVPQVITQAEWDAIASAAATSCGR